MCRFFGLSLLVASIAGGMLTLSLPAYTLRAGGKDTAKGKDTGKDTAKDTGKDTGKPKEKIDHAKLKPDQAKVDVQKEKGERHYKEIFETEVAPPFFETSHFLIYGQSGRGLVTVGGDMEKAYALACKALKLEPNPGPWPGKLTVILVHDAKRYAQAIRILQRRKADEDEYGSYDLEGVAPHVVASPTKAPGELGMEATACTQMGAWLVSHKGRVRLPEWVAEGFGRATTLHAWGPAVLGANRRKAAAFVTKSNRSVGDITGTGLPAEEMPILRASLFDYLAYSGRTEKLLPIVDGFNNDGKGNAGSFAVGLTKANMTEADLNKNWQNYAKSFK